MKFYVTSRVNAVIYVVGLSAFIILPAEKIEPTVEDNYVKLFGKKANSTDGWYPIKHWMEEEDQLKVKKLCAAAHKRMFGKASYIIDSLVYKTGTLSFNCSKYRPMKVYFVEYGLRTKHIPPTLREYMFVDENARWYVTRGLHKGCVFYLTLLNSSVMEFNLEKQICGLKHKYIRR